MFKVKNAYHLKTYKIISKQLYKQKMITLMNFLFLEL